MKLILTSMGVQRSEGIKQIKNAIDGLMSGNNEGLAEKRVLVIHDTEASKIQGFVDGVIRSLNKLGFSGDNITVFNCEGGADSDIKSQTFDYIYVGEARDIFKLVRELQESNMLGYIRDSVKERGSIYIGTSAGAMLAGELTAAKLMGEKSPNPIPSGLELLPETAIFPHLRSGKILYGNLDEEEKRIFTAYKKTYFISNEKGVSINDERAIRVRAQKQRAEKQRIRKMFFTADLHLGHANVIGFDNRPFDDVEEMNRVLIQNINDMVGEDDELWVLGDFSYGIDKDGVRELRNRIKCRHVNLVAGNHDKDYTNEDIFESVQAYKEIKTPYGLFVLFHYPLLDWRSGHSGSVMLHGHIHSTGAYNNENLQRLYAGYFPYGHKERIPNLNLRIYDVGVDANDYRPVSIDKLAELMQLTKTKKSEA